jgi:protein involved in polysaccharide export with SLBB domain
VKVLGAVHRPGLYPVHATMSLGDVVAMAGGADWSGRRDSIELRRDGSRIRAQLDQATVVMDLPIRSGDEIVVRQRGWFARNPGVVVGGLSAVLGISIALMAR